MRKKNKPPTKPPRGTKVAIKAVGFLDEIKICETCTTSYLKKRKIGKRKALKCAYGKNCKPCALWEGDHIKMTRYRNEKFLASHQTVNGNVIRRENGQQSLMGKKKIYLQTSEKGFLESGPTVKRRGQFWYYDIMV